MELNPNLNFRWIWFFAMVCLSNLVKNIPFTIFIKKNKTTLTKGLHTFFFYKSSYLINKVQGNAVNKI